MSRSLILAALVPLAAGCGRAPGRTAEVHGADGGRFYATVYHFLTAASDYDRASYVHGGETFRDDMGRHFAGRPPVASVRVDAVEAEAGDSATVTARVGYADGTAGVVKVVVRKGAPLTSSRA